MKPLQNRHVLITRNAAQAGSLEDKLTAHGAVVSCVPTIRIIDPPDWHSFDQAARHLGDYSWVVFTSVNAVSQTKKRLEQLQLDDQAIGQMRVAAIGDQTALEVEACGWPVHLIPDKFQAEGLLEKLLQTDMAGQRVWLPRALRGRETLITQLEAAGATVTLTPVYQNVAPLENRDRLVQILAGGTIDWITFTSSSTVNNFFLILGESRSQGQLPKLASIGSATTQTLVAHSLKPAFTADPQNLEGLCRGLIEWETHRHQSHETY